MMGLETRSGGQRAEQSLRPKCVDYTFFPFRLFFCFLSFSLSFFNYLFYFQFYPFFLASSVRSFLFSLRVHVLPWIKRLE